MIDLTPYDNFDEFFSWYLKMIESKVPYYWTMKSDDIHKSMGLLTKEERNFTIRAIRDMHPVPKRIVLVNDNSEGTFYAAWDKLINKPIIAFPSVMMYWLKYPPIVKGIIDHELGHCWGDNPDILTDKTKYPRADLTNISMDVRINQNIDYEVLAQIYKCVYTFDNNYFEVKYVPEYWNPNKCALPATFKKATWEFLYSQYERVKGSESPEEEDVVLKVGNYVQTLITKYGKPKGTYGRISKVININEYVVNEISLEEIDAIKNDDYEFFRNIDSIDIGVEIGDYFHRARKDATYIPYEIVKIPIPDFQENKPKQGDIAIIIVDKPSILKGKFGMVMKEESENKYVIAELSDTLQSIIPKKDFDLFIKEIESRNPFTNNQEVCVFGKEFILFDLKPKDDNTPPPPPPENKNIKKPQIGDVLIITKDGSNKNKFGVIVGIVNGLKSDGSDAKYEIQEISEEIAKLKTGKNIIQ